MSQPVRVGIAGLGRSGWDIHAAGLAELPLTFRIVAVADMQQSRLDEAADRFGSRGYPALDGLLADDDVELVVIATPSHTHAASGLAALDAGKHVVIEKPMAGNVEDLDRLISRADERGLLLTAFHNQRLDPVFLTARDVIESGRIGRPVLIRRTTHRFTRRSDWQTLRAMGGGELANTALHFLDQLLTLIPLTERLDVLGDLRRLNSAGDAEDHAKVMIRPERGPVLEVEASCAVASPQPTLLVIGSAGTIIGHSDRLDVTWTDLSTLPPVTASTAAPQDRAYTSGEQYQWQTEKIAVPPPTRRTQAYYERLYGSLRHDDEVFVSPASVRRVLQVLERARAGTAFA